MVIVLLAIFDLLEVCEAYMKGKKNQQLFPQEVNLRNKSPLQLANAHLSGIMNTKYLGGPFYFMSLIDNNNRKIFVEFLMESS